MKVQKELLYESGGPIPSCHASTLTFAPDGTLLTAFFGGTKENADDVEIYLCRRTDSGWSEPQRMSVPSGDPTWNPVLFTDGDAVHLWYKRFRPIARWRTFTRILRDGVWSEERELIPEDRSGGRGPVKNKPIRLSDGTILAGASHESEDGKTWRAFADLSRDGGKTWTRTDYVPAPAGVKLIQPAVWQSEEGVHMLLRSDAGFIYRSDSADGGQNWCRAYPTDLPNNNSGLDAVRMSDGTLALVCNPVAANWGARTPLTLFLSRDNGRTWERAADLETEPGEYSYPAVISRDGELHITYTYRRKTVAYCRVTL
ncbi:MAG: exo-alpha-sialidase [Clostridia bacterium]|nr:exo-alpha-sialidase [Clostridia bacterium]